LASNKRPLRLEFETEKGGTSNSRGKGRCGGGENPVPKGQRRSVVSFHPSGRLGKGGTL